MPIINNNINSNKKKRKGRVLLLLLFGNYMVVGSPRRCASSHGFATPTNLNNKHSSINPMHPPINHMMWLKLP